MIAALFINGLTACKKNQDKEEGKAILPTTTAMASLSTVLESPGPDLADKRLTVADLNDFSTDQDLEAWTHQIVEDDEALPTSDLHIKTIWTGIMAGIKYKVYTGYSSKDPKQGMAVVTAILSGSDKGSHGFEVKTPLKEGTLRAVTDDGTQVILQSEAGNLFGLNMETHKLEQEGFNVAEAQLPITFILDKDLDGDRKLERLALSGSLYNNPPFTFTVNGKDQVAILTSSMQQLQGTFSIVDLNLKDSSKQLAFPQTGPSGMSMTTYFSFDANTGEITQLGTVPGNEDSIRYPGNGQIITESQRGSVLSTWFHEQTYTWEKQGRIERVEQDLYKANLEVTLKEELDLYTSRSNRTIKGTLKVDEKAVIELSDDKKWFLIRGENGVKGWFEIRDISFVINAGLEATDLFDGLGNAG